MFRRCFPLGFWPRDVEVEPWICRFGERVCVCCGTSALGSSYIFFKTLILVWYLCGVKTSSLGRFDYCNYVIVVVPFGPLAVTYFDTTLQWIVGFPLLEHLG